MTPPDKLKKITVQQAETLVKRAGWKLSVGGLTSITSDAAEVLAKHEHALSLKGLTRLTERSAEALAKHRGMLDLSGLARLAPKTAKTLAKHQDMLILNGLTAVSEDGAQALAKCVGDLYLDGLTAISDKTARALAKQRGKLHLNGLTAISDKAAMALGTHKGELYLNGLTTLREKAVEGIRKHEGWLSLNGLPMKKLFFVQDHSEDAVKVEEFLERRFRYDCRQAKGLRYLYTDLKEDRDEGKPYDVLITSVPMDSMLDFDSIENLPKKEMYDKIYWRSLGIILQAKESNPGLVVIAYTGADDRPEVRELFRELGKLDAVIFRKGYKRDIPALEKVLRQFDLLPCSARRRC